MEIASVRQRTKEIRSREPESAVRIDVVRDRGVRTLEATLGTSNREIGMFRILDPGPDAEARLGLELETPPQ